ncbi:hypothetical protein OG895_18520 [Streptomyces sp. NBC_00201]|uniref:hypothetical protein n=1 Tax=Streptomyces sp. NBC_00201 TaxID=2975679 RepID=UPI002251A95B|nr:hypothetical protein [Streptomyces sp. NBC_00201]MCX5247188.1 hypothetical protein [Streptomyces sp. NBC_00201]
MTDVPNLNTPQSIHRVDHSDEDLSRQLRGAAGRKPAPWSYEELLVRHWRPVFEYAELCTVPGAAAGVLAASAFTRVFVDTLRLAGPTAAWRPELLATVHRVAADWAQDPRRGACLHPDLRSRYGHAGARPSVPENRRLAYQAFQRLVEPARCLLWHVEVDAEGVEVPTALLGLAPETAAIRLESSRALFRQACVAAHRDLAPDETCLRFSRLLEVSVQRGGTHLVPDLQHHIASCTHCRYAAEQLDHAGDHLGLLIAEAVLIWGARPYLAWRPARRTPPEHHAAAGSYGQRLGTHRGPPSGRFSAGSPDSAPPLSA